MESEIVGVTGILVTCSYANQEFFRVGYYVNNYYEELELAENPPEKPLIDRLIRPAFHDEVDVEVFLDVVCPLDAAKRLIIVDEGVGP